MANKVFYKYKGLSCKNKKDLLAMINEIEADDLDWVCAASRKNISDKLQARMFSADDDYDDDDYGDDDYGDGDDDYGDYDDDDEPTLPETMSNKQPMPKDVEKLYEKLYDIVSYVKGKFCKDNKIQLKKFKQYLKDLVREFCSNNRFENVLMTNVRYISRPLAYL